MSGEIESAIQSMQRGDVDNAISLLQSFCEHNPQNYDAHMYLGAAFGKAGRPLDSIRILTKAVEIQPGNPQARYNLALAMEHGGYIDHALSLLQQALSLQPDYDKAVEALNRIQSIRAENASPVTSPAEVNTSSASNRSASTEQNHYDYAPVVSVETPTYIPDQQSYTGQPTYKLPPGYQTPLQPAETGNIAIQPQLSSPYPQSNVPYQASSPYSSPMQPRLQNAAYNIPQATEAPGFGGIALGVILGSIAATIGIILWVGLVMLTKFQIGFAAMGVGALIGWMVKLGVRKPGKTAGTISMVIALIAMGTGCLITNWGSTNPISILFTLLFVYFGVKWSYRLAAR